MKVIMIPIGISAHGMIPKEMVKKLENLEIRGQLENTLTTITIGQNT